MKISDSWSTTAMHGECVLLLMVCSTMWGGIFFAFDDVVRNGENSKYKNWFYHLQFPVERPEDPETYPTYECFGYERMMPKTNTCNPEVQEYFCEVGRYWVREFDIDGWRLDVASEINDGFWRAFRQAVKEEKAGVYPDW